MRTRSTVETVCDLAKGIFTEHVIAREFVEKNDLFTVGHWRFKNPRTWSYGFDVTIIPGRLYLSGDIGHLSITRCSDVVAWCRDIIQTPSSPDLICFHDITKKVPSQIQTDCWTEHAAESAFRHIVRKHEISLSEIRNLKGSTHNEFEWNNLVRDICDRFGLDEIPSAKEYSPDFVWCVLGLRAFLDHLPVISLDTIHPV